MYFQSNLYYIDFIQKNRINLICYGKCYTIRICCNPIHVLFSYKLIMFVEAMKINNLKKNLRKFVCDVQLFVHFQSLFEELNEL